MTAVMRDRLEDVFRRAGIPEETVKYFEGAYIEKVKVSRRNRSWTFYLVLGRPVPPQILFSVQDRIREAFRSVAEIRFSIRYGQANLSQLMEMYWQWIRKRVADQLSPSAAGWLARAEWQLEGERLTLVFANPMMNQMAVAKQLDQVVASLFQEISGTRIQVALTFRESDEAREKFLEEREETERQLVEEAMIHLEESIPPEEGPEEEGPVAIGYDFHDEPILIKEITDEERRVCIRGAVFKSEVRELRSGRTLLTFHVTDYTDSIAVKVFARDKEDAAIVNRVKDGMWMAIRGSVQFDTFARDLVVMANDLKEVPPYRREDTAEEKRVELHLHTAMSAMDGVHEPAVLVKQAAQWGHPAVAITDHGVLQGYPDAYSAGQKHGIKVIFGLEANVVDDGVPIAMNAAPRTLKEDTYVVFDVETTGLSAVHDEIIELAAVKVKDGEIIDRFESFINPHRKLTATITELTGITDEMVVDAPELSEVLPRYLEFIEGTVLVAHNARFDMGFLQAACKKTGYQPVDHPVVDTLELGRFLYPRLKNHRLNTLCKQFDIELTQHHRAIYDAEATGFLLWRMLQDCIERKIVRLDQLNEYTGERDLNRLRPFHVIVLVKNHIGLKNLYKLVSLSHLKYFYRTPRIPRSLLEKHREGLIIGSGCEKGELFEAALQKSPEEVEEMARFYDYLEIQPVDVNRHLLEKEIVASEEHLRQANQLLLKIGDKLNKPVVATSNTHYLNKWEAIYRDILAFNQTGGFRNKGPLSPAHFRTTDEMLAEFSYLGEERAREVVVVNPRKIADEIEELKPFPEGLHTPIIEGSDDELRRICYETAENLYGNPLPEIVEQRLEKELGSIIKHGFGVIYLISHKLVTKSLSDGYLVGSRGSVGSSFVATMSHITEVNPLPPHYVCPECKHSEFIADGSVASGFDMPDKDCPECGTRMKKDGHDIPFETFLGFKGDKVPDIDLNFSGEYQPRAHKYTEELFGKDYVYRAGTISTVAQKTAYGYAKKYQEEKGYQWRNAEIDRMVEGCTGVKRTTGQHPGGLVVIPQNKEVYDFTPIQRPADDVKSETTTTHFDYHAISDNLLKLDILGHDDPTVIRMLQDLTGVDPRSIPVDDPEVMKLFNSTESLGVTPEEIGTVTGTLGIPEFGTRFVRQMLEDTKPTTFGELVRISGLSHGTDVWLNNAQDLVRSKTAVLSEVISTRDDIMIYLIYKGMEPSLAFKLMEKVRKGKGLTDEEADLMRNHDVPQWYIDSCRKIKYMFPKAHAVAYVMMAVRIAWFKVHYPIEYYATYFSVRADDFDVEIALKGMDAVKKTIRDIEEKGVTASPKEKGLLTILESVREMLARGLSFQRVDLYRSDATRFLVDGDSLIPPFSSVSGVGTNAARNIAEAREKGEFLSIEDLTKRARLSSAVIDVLKRLGCLEKLPESNQLTLF
ncbi:PolC-type DNA polymerase III [Kroppenstedtia eburnea]|uniref:DNA polymerase III PolC-type n=1 Tax=Kroppenstedtia eburnea TaxID=714067 RepID=A0A1N7IVR4_9BACL|nr:PolC-type DNA polymerase III [Kroppenstedtia eburnea]QKI83739.1 PolC-type DNA polymerase III [Kroppenstedtia eburnea]SIS41127.1 DNA polymerase III catalytic subunit, PolC type [Kroppenstedtia eburnea]